jgi:hypothetical protein
MPRILHVYPMMRARDAASVDSYPMIAGIPMMNIHTCVMHAVIAFGKDMLLTIEKYILSKQSVTPNIITIVDNWMDKNRINVHFR